MSATNPPLIFDSTFKQYTFFLWYLFPFNVIHEDVISWVPFIDMTVINVSWVPILTYLKVVQIHSLIDYLCLSICCAVIHNCPWLAFLFWWLLNIFNPLCGCTKSWTVYSLVSAIVLSHGHLEHTTLKVLSLRCVFFFYQSLP